MNLFFFYTIYPPLSYLREQLDNSWRCVLADYGFARKARMGVATAMTMCGKFTALLYGSCPRGRLRLVRQFYALVLVRTFALLIAWRLQEQTSLWPPRFYGARRMMSEQVWLAGFIRAFSCAMRHCCFSLSFRDTIIYRGHVGP